VTDAVLTMLYIQMDFTTVAIKKSDNLNLFLSVYNIRLFHSSLYGER